MRKIILLLLITIPIIISAQEKVTWDYPVKPGSEEWKMLSSHQEMVETCQIPSNILPKIPTEELTQICLNYPLFFTMKAFNNLQTGFNQVSTEFNGFLELFKRKDSGVELLKTYQKEKIKAIDEKTTLLEKGAYMERIFFIEFILSQNEIIEKLNQNEIKQLLSETIYKLEEKKKYNFSTFSTQTTPLIMCRVLENKKFEQYVHLNSNDGKFKYFSNAIILSDKKMINELSELTKEYLKTIK